MRVRRKSRKSSGKELMPDNVAAVAGGPAKRAHCFHSSLASAAPTAPASPDKVMQGVNDYEKEVQPKRSTRAASPGGTRTVERAQPAPLHRAQHLDVLDRKGSPSATVVRSSPDGNPVIRLSDALSRGLWLRYGTNAIAPMRDRSGAANLLESACAVQV